MPPEDYRNVSGGGPRDCPCGAPLEGEKIAEVALLGCRRCGACFVSLDEIVKLTRSSVLAWRLMLSIAVPLVVWLIARGVRC